MRLAISGEQECWGLSRPVLLTQRTSQLLTFHSQVQQWGREMYSSHEVGRDSGYWISNHKISVMGVFLGIFLEEVMEIDGKKVRQVC